MTGLLSKVKFASDIQPALAEHLVGKRIERVEWHDGHGGVIVLHTEDGTRLAVCTPGTVDASLRDPGKLHVGLTKEKR